MNFDKEALSKNLIRAFKIALGSSLAIFIAELMQLEFATSAGIIALLTIVNTKWATLKLAVTRFLSFVITVLLAYFSFQYVNSEWISFGIFILVLICLSYYMGWESAISVNAVVGTHLLMTHDFHMQSVVNEFFLLLIGTLIAVILNSLMPSQKQRILKDIQYVEQELQNILCEMAMYLRHEEMSRNVWNDIKSLEAYLEPALQRAYEYQDNTLASHPGYYIHYMEMRMKQCNELHNLHYEIKKIRMMPVQSKAIAEYVIYLKEHVTKIDSPEKQIEELEQIFIGMKEEPLPQTREEFESRAILYHILMDLEEYLLYNKRFVEELTDLQKTLYLEKRKG